MQTTAVLLYLYQRGFTNTDVTSDEYWLLIGQEQASPVCIALQLETVSQLASSLAVTDNHYRMSLSNCSRYVLLYIATLWVKYIRGQEVAVFQQRQCEIPNFNLPPNSPKWEISSRKLCIFWKKLSDKKFSDRLQFRRGCNWPHATTSLTMKHCVSQPMRRFHIYGGRALSIVVLTVWNSLPDELRYIYGAQLAVSDSFLWQYCIPSC